MKNKWNTAFIAMILFLSSIATITTSEAINPSKEYQADKNLKLKEILSHPYGKKLFDTIAVELAYTKKTANTNDIETIHSIANIIETIKTNLNEKKQKLEFEHLEVKRAIMGKLISINVTISSNEEDFSLVNSNLLLFKETKKNAEKNLKNFKQQLLNNKNYLEEIQNIIRREQNLYGIKSKNHLALLETMNVIINELFKVNPINFEKEAQTAIYNKITEITANLASYGSGNPVKSLAEIMKFSDAKNLKECLLAFNNIKKQLEVFLEFDNDYLNKVKSNYQRISDLINEDIVFLNNLIKRQFENIELYNKQINEVMGKTHNLKQLVLSVKDEYKTTNASLTQENKFYIDQNKEM